MATPGILPEWADSPQNADLNSMAGPIQAATTYTPTSQSLVSGQLERLLSKDSPYLSMARTRASQLANSRGLLNSSIAATAGEAAAIDASLPIAQQDATTFGNAERFNADSTNTFAREANAFGREGALQKYRGVLETNAYNKDDAFKRDELAYRERATAGDDAFRRDELGFREGSAERDDLFRRDELGFRSTSTGRELDIREADLAAQRAIQSRGQDFQQTELDAKTAAANADRQAQLSQDVARIRQAAMDARTRLETDPNLSAEGKRDAILSLGQQASADIQELVRLSGINLPDAWPGWINELSPVEPGAVAPAPAPAPTTPTTPGTRATLPVELPRYLDDLRGEG